jgi:Lrp/AsnC family leucine-responsive transcriptional regulator
MRQIDEIDWKILRVLQFNARITNAELAKRVSLSPSPCWNRVRRLEASGVIEKYVTIISQSAIGMPDSVILEAKLAHHDKDALNRFEQELTSLPEVVEAYLVTGEYDYIVRVAAAGTEGYERFLRERVYRLPSIEHTRSSFALRSLKQTYSAQPLMSER